MDDRDYALIWVATSCYHFESYQLYSFMKRRAIMGGVEGGSKVLIEDRLSDLPDQIAHHILSSLNVFDLIRFCCVSKRCSELSLSSPCLNFDDIPPEFKSTCYKRLQMMSYLDRFLFRRGDNKVQLFRVKWERHYMDENETVCICSSEHYRLHTWINYAVTRNVETLDLKTALYDADNASFPSSVFLSGTLRSLVLDMNFTLIRTPSFVFPSNLSKLKLEDVVIEDERFFKWISCTCKCIQELHLDLIRGIQAISIESSSLKIIRFLNVHHIAHLSISGEKLEHITVGWYIEPYKHSSFNVCAPNLKAFSWFGKKLMTHLSLGKFRCLESASFRLIPDEDEVDKMYEVLRSLGKVKSLIIDEATIKAPFSKRSMPAPISDIHRLAMDIGRVTDELVPAMVSLFRGLPNLFILCIQYKPNLDGPRSNTSGFDMDYWKLQNLAFVNQLMLLSIELCNDSNAIDLARYILEYAPNLLKVFVKICLPQDTDVVKMKLNECRIHSGALILYH